MDILDLFLKLQGFSRPQDLVHQCEVHLFILPDKLAAVPTCSDRRRAANSEVIRAFGFVLGLPFGAMAARPSCAVAPYAKPEGCLYILVLRLRLWKT